MTYNATNLAFKHSFENTGLVAIVANGGGADDLQINCDGAKLKWNEGNWN